MVTICESGWLVGKSKQLTVNYHYKERCRSMKVPPGYMVTFYEKQDREGWKSLIFYEGEYTDLTFHGVPEKPGLIHVENTDLTHLDLVEVAYGTWMEDQKSTYLTTLKLPIGDRRYGADFPNDRVSHLRIPYGVTMEVFDNDDFQGGSLFFSGDVQGGTSFVNLDDYDYDGKVSSIRIRADEWVSAGVAFENVEINDSAGEVFGGSVRLDNNTSKDDQTVTETITAEITEETSEEWNIEAGVTASVGFEAGYEGGTVAKATGNLEVSVSGGYGESKTTSKTKTFESQATAIADAYQSVIASMYIQIGEMTADSIRKWRNKRTNVIIEQRGRMRTKNGINFRVEYSEPK